MEHWWAAWLAAGLAAETIAVIYSHPTLSQTIRSIINSRGRQWAWAAFCVWGIHHILSED